LCLRRSPSPVKACGLPAPRRRTFGTAKGERMGWELGWSLRRSGMVAFLSTLVLCLVAFPRSARADSLSVNGTTGYVVVPNAPELNPSSAMTIEAWVYRNNGTACETVVGKNYTHGFWLGFCGQGIRFYTNGLGTSRDSTQPVLAGRWTHIAV